MPRMNRQLVVAALIAALGVTGCDIAPGHPVLEGDDGPSSLTPSDEAFASPAEGSDTPIADAAREAPQEHGNPEND